MDILEEFEAVAASLPAFQMYFKIKGVATTELFRKRADGEYAYGDVRICFEIWKAAKAQAVPDTYTPIVLALEDVQSKIAQASFLTMDADNENEVYAVDANELHEYIDELIEAQEPK